MAKLLKLRRGSTSGHNSFTGAEGEVTVDITKDTAVVHDGSTAGGRPLAREDMNNVSSASIVGRLADDAIAVGKIAAGTLPSDVKIADANVSGNLTIANADVNSDAAIAGSKIDPDFGSQTITTTGTVNTGLINASSASDQILNLNSSDNGAVYLAFKRSGGRKVYFGLGGSGSTVSLVNEISDGDIIITGNDGGSTINMLSFNTSENGRATFIGDISVGGTVDGRDVAADGIKLDGIEASATADQTAAEIRTLVGSASDSNVFTDNDHSKLDGIEASATADQTASEIVALVADQTIAPSEIDMEDNEKIKIGTSDDLQIYHDGNHSRIDDTGTGSLVLRSSNFLVEKYGGDYMIHGVADGAVELYYDGSKKLETTSTGVQVTGGLVASGNVTAFSDSRLKTEIHTIKDPLEKVDRLRGVTFKWLHTNKPSSGVIAQEVQEVFPELVEATTHEGKEVLSVDYGKLVGVLIESIKELKAEFEAHKAECAKLHGGE